MPFKSKAQMRTCKYCPKLARRNVINGRNKGYLRTCGSKECLTVQYRSKEVTDKKCVARIIACALCGERCRSTNARQKYCKECVPNQAWRAIAARYNIGKKRWEALLEEQGGTCALCEDGPKVVDHDHTTGETRGLLCYSCNLLIAGLDCSPDWVKLAQAYIERSQ